MNYFRSRKLQSDNWWFVVLILFSFILLCKKLISSWYWIYAVILVVLFIIILFIIKYVENFQKSIPAQLWDEYKKKYPIIMQYAPPKWINPAEAWLLYNLRVDPTDLTSLIYQWKFDWLIDIEMFVWKKSKKEYVKLIKKDDMPFSRPLFESDIFDSIFSMWDVKIIEDSFQMKYALLLDDLEYHWIRKWRIYRPEISKEWKHFHSFLFFLLCFCLLIILFDAFVIFSNIFWIIFCILLLLFILSSWYVYGWWKLKFTEKWAELASQVIGYRNFIKSCDENKIKLFLKQDPLFVDRTLPYATAFGMETKFLKDISPLKSEWNDKYIRGKKVPVWARVLRMLIWWSWDESLL